MNPLVTKLRISRLAIGRAILTTSASAAPTGLDPVGQLQLTDKHATVNPESFAFTQLQNGIQFRVGGMVKNVLFYGTDIVRVNASLGQIYMKQSVKSILYMGKILRREILSWHIVAPNVLPMMPMSVLTIYSVIQTPLNF